MTLLLLTAALAWDNGLCFVDVFEFYRFYGTGLYGFMLSLVSSPFRLGKWDVSLGNQFVMVIFIHPNLIAEMSVFFHFFFFFFTVYVSLDNYYVLYLYALPQFRTHRYAWYARAFGTHALEKERKGDSKKRPCVRIREWEIECDSRVVRQCE